MTCCGKKLSTEVRELKFRPDYHVKSLTEKFYSRYEALDTDIASRSSQLYHVDHHMKEIHRRLIYDPRAQFYAPITENQVYGWTEGLAIRYCDSKDRNLVFYPKKRDEEMEVMRKIVHEMHTLRKLKIL